MTNTESTDKTVSIVSPLFAPVLEKLDNSPSPLAPVLAKALRVVPVPSGTMRAWMQAHDSQRVHTVQVDNRSGAVWVPLSRAINSREFAGSVTLDGSIRPYAGMRVLHSAPDLLVVADSWHTVAYVVA